MTRTPLALLALAACSPRPYDFSASATDTGGSTSSSASTSTSLDPTTSSPTTSTPPDTTTSTTDDDSAGGTGHNFIVQKDSGVGVKECDPWLENCPAGQKCMPYAKDGAASWDALKCVPIVRDPDGLGEPCMVFGTAVSGEDTCDKHLMCWDVDPDTGVGRCVAKCDGAPDQPSCGPPCTSCLIDAAGVVLICLPRCDPLWEGYCGVGECAPEQLAPGCFDCLEPGAEAPLFAPCDAANDCAFGLFCGDPKLALECDPMATGCCLPLCDLDAPECPGQDQQCVPWYAPNKAPAGLENVGSCALTP